MLCPHTTDGRASRSNKMSSLVMQSIFNIYTVSLPLLFLWRHDVCLDPRSRPLSGYLLLGVRTVPVPHGLDGSVLRVPYPCHSKFVSTACTDGGRDGLGPSKTVIVRPSQPSDGCTGIGYLRSFTGLKIFNLADQSARLCHRLVAAVRFTSRN
jgi:hypothetical protein